MQREWPVAVGLFIISAAILTLEVLQMRILAVQMWYHYAYVVVTMSLLGFAAAGTVATLVPRLTRDPVGPTLAWCSTAFGASVIVGFLGLAGPGNVVAAQASRGDVPALLLYDFLMILPYFFGGLAITIALSSSDKVHSRYFFNLLGSAMGAWIFVVFIAPVGGERLVALCGVAGPVAGLAFLGPRPRGRTLAVCILVMLVGWQVVWRADTWLAVEIGEDRRAQFTGEFVERRWTPLARLDLFERPSNILIVQDGGAGTGMYNEDFWQPRAVWSPQGMAYVPHLQRVQEGGEPPDVVAIGIGGGNDIRVSKDFGARSFLGIEINGGMREIVEDYEWLNGGVYDQPGVEIVIGEGRSTLRRLGRKFDVIQISGADTYTAGTSGSFVLHESYLYTSQAFQDYFDHLTEHGTFGVFRLSEDPPRETLRLFGMALLALRERGIEKPSEHAVIVQHLFSGGAVYSMQPFTEKELSVYRMADQDPSGNYKVLYTPGWAEDNAYTRLAAAVDAGTEDQFFADYPYDVTPVSDDSPFYYDFERWSDIWSPTPEDATTQVDAADTSDVGHYVPSAPSILGATLIQTTVLVFALVLLPLGLRKRAGLTSPAAGRHLTYFMGLGLAFMLLEISTLQRLVLFLGHPTYSISVTLFCFLFFAGLGSLISGRLGGDPSRRLRRVNLVLVAVILVFTFALTPILDALLHLELGARIAVAIALLAPMNLLMGMPFPLGLARLRTLEPQLVPWALGVNGGASVLGSVLCVILAMESGFTVVSAISALVYGVGALVATSGPLRPADTSRPA